VRRVTDDTLVVDLVKQERCIQPQIGTRKLQVLLTPSLKAQGVTIGRDRLFAVLKREGLLIKKRRRGQRTTDSRHHYHVYTNRFADAMIDAPHQAWVSDLTYVRVGDGFRYLSLVTDACSRKIVGWHLHQTLEASGPYRAAQMAIRQLPEGATPLHHSDRGCQYCCYDYIDLLTDAGVGISMTEINHCYENAMAERLNGILKHEYGLKDRFASMEQALQATKQAIALYNGRRPHFALNYETPNACHEAVAISA
jgi:putative transposase